MTTGRPSDRSSTVGDAVQGSRRQLMASSLLLVGWLIFLAVTAFTA